MRGLNHAEAQLFNFNGMFGADISLPFMIAGSRFFKSGQDGRKIFTQQNP
jgi:hypothetical protein